MARQITPTRPHILMGVAQAVPLRERTMRGQVEAYLGRMRHTLPFPCSAEECYFGCVPPAVKQWYDDGLFEMDAPIPGKASNLLSTMYSTSVKQPGKRHILHISVEEADEFLEAERGNRGHEDIFWIGIPEHVPVPRMNAQTPFFLPTDHPYHREINDWVKQAFTIEDEIQTSLELIERYQALVKTPTQVVNTWPEILNFVHMPGAMGKRLSRQVSHELREQAAEVMRPTDKEALTTQLARAVMLPEQSPPLLAWVKFYTQEMG